MRRRQTTLDVVVLVAVLGAGAVVYWYASWHSRKNWAEDHGKVISRGVQMPPIKQMAPVRYYITIRNAESKTVTYVTVSRDVYERATPGTSVHRDKEGTIVVDASR